MSTLCPVSILRRFCECFVARSESDEVYDELKKHFSEEEIIELGMRHISLSLCGNTPQ
jgi:hypothetical protein